MDRQPDDPGIVTPFAFEEDDWMPKMRRLGLAVLIWIGILTLGVIALFY